MQELGLPAYRFSVAWPRVQPAGRGPVNPAGLDFYDRLVDSLLAAGIRPFLTLYHWDLPQALQDSGGWDNRATCGYFADYAALVAKRLGDRVHDWMTLNEPQVVAFNGNENGAHAPGFRDPHLATRVAHHLLVAHGLATQTLRALAPYPRVGIVLDFAPAEPATGTPENRATAEAIWQRSGTYFMDPLFRGHYAPAVEPRIAAADVAIQPGDMALIAQPLDFLGINFYRRQVFDTAGNMIHVPGAEYTEMDWEVHAPAFTRLLERLDRDYRLPPLYITENGAAFVDEVSADGQVHDERRAGYLRAHLGAVRDAIAAGVDIDGYFVWSLLDNFEWARGYEKRFGIVHVDFATQQRTIKDSGRLYARAITQNAVP